VLGGVLRLFVLHENTKGCIGIKLQAFGLNSGRQIPRSNFCSFTRKLDDSTERSLGQVTANITSTGFFFCLFNGVFNNR